MKPFRAFLHPAWVVGLAVLALNDHVLKHLGVLPNIVTGKLSDFAGLFVAPAFIATIVFARSKRSVIAVHALVAAAFAIFKVFAPATRLVESALSLFVPSRMWTDPTDLIALPMVAIAYAVLAKAMREPIDEPRSVARGLAQRAFGIAAAVMCVATSQATPPPLVWVNDTGAPLTFEVRSAKPGVMFSPMALSDTSFPCDAVLFEDQGTPRTFAAGDKRDDGAFAMARILIGSQDFVIAQPRGEVHIRKGPSGFELITNGGPVVTREIATGQATCGKLPSAQEQLTLPTTKTSGTVTITNVTQNGDCATLTFKEVSQSATVCAPTDAVSFAVGDVFGLYPGSLRKTDGSLDISAYDLADTQIFGTLGFEAVTDAACKRSDACGNVAIDATLQVNALQLKTGDDKTETSGAKSVRYVVREVSSLQIQNANCTSVPQLSSGSFVVKMLRITSGPPTSPPVDAGTDADPGDAGTD